MNPNSTTMSEASHLRDRYSQKAAELEATRTTAIAYRNALIAISTVLEKQYTEDGHAPTNAEIAIAALCHELLRARP